MSLQEVAMTAIGQIIRNFRLVPSKEPKRVVAQLDQFLQLQTKAERAKMTEHRMLLLDMAEAELTDDFADDETNKLRETFEVYFNEIFDLYVDPDRKVVIL